VIIAPRIFSRFAPAPVDNDPGVTSTPPTTKETVMRTTCRGIALSLVVTFLAAGPLAPFARAQAPQTTTTAEGDLFQESIKSSPTARTEAPTAGYQAVAGLVDVFYVPGKVITCTAGIVADTILLALTFGTAYRAAADIARAGCGGKWYVTPADLRPDVVSRDADWEDPTLR
jgi:hypothetical protein